MLQNRICTFIDILGFKNLVYKADADLDFARQIYQSLSLINNAQELLNDDELKSTVQYVLSKNANKDIVFDFPEKSSSYIKGISFSDSLIINSEPTFEGWLNHILLIILLTHKLLELGFLVRGGISVGNLVQENNLVFGTGLVKAYDLESKISNYPRITISDEALQNLYEIEPEKGTLSKFFSSDFDGIVFLDCLEEAALRIASYSDKKEIHELMQKDNMRYATRIQTTRDALQRIIESNRISDNKVLAKLRWIAIKMNQSLSSKEFYLVDDVKIPNLTNSSSIKN